MSFHVLVRQGVRPEQLPDRLRTVGGYEEVDLRLGLDELRGSGLPEHRLGGMMKR